MQTYENQHITTYDQLKIKQSEPILKILSVEDSEDDFYLIKTYITRHLKTAELSHVTTISEMNKMLTTHDFDIILLDLFLGGESSFKFISKLKLDHHLTEIIVISAQEEIRTAVECIELGASYISKGKLLETDLIKTLYHMKRLITTRLENSILKEMVFQSENIPLAFLKMDEIDYLVYKDFEYFPEDINESLEVFLHKFGTYSIVGIGQGEAYNVGLYQLPAGPSKKYSAFVYAMRLEDKSAYDPRLELGFFLYCMFIPNNMIGFIKSLEELANRFETLFKPFKSIDELKESDLDQIKQNIIDFIKNQ